jgi:hypothetical protein
LNRSPKPKLPTMQLPCLRSLHIENQYLTAQEWSSLLPRLTCPDLEALHIRGRPTIRALSEFLSRHDRVEKLHIASRWAVHTPCIRSGLPRNTLQLPLLSEIEGPPCHLQAVLKCLSCVADGVTIKIESSLEMTYSQYVRAILVSVGLCGPHVNVKIRLSRYVLDHDNKLTSHQVKSLSNIKLPEVASLEINFPSMSERSLLVCPHSFAECVTI